MPTPNEPTSKIFRSQKYKGNLKSNIKVPTGMSEISVQRRIGLTSAENNNLPAQLIKTEQKDLEVDSQYPTRCIKLVKSKTNTTDRLNILWKFEESLSKNAMKDPTHITMTRSSNPTEVELADEKKRYESYLEYSKNEQTPEVGKGSIFRGDDYQYRNRKFYEKKYRSQLLLEDEAGNAYIGKQELQHEKSAFVVLFLNDKNEYEMVPIDATVKFSKKIDTLSPSDALDGDIKSNGSEINTMSYLQKTISSIQNTVASMQTGVKREHSYSEEDNSSGSDVELSADEHKRRSMYRKKARKGDSEDEQDPDIKPSFSDDDEKVELVSSDEERREKSKVIRKESTVDPTNNDFWESDDDMDEDGKAIKRLLQVDVKGNSAKNKDKTPENAPKKDKKSGGNSGSNSDSDDGSNKVSSINSSTDSGESSADEGGQSVVDGANPPIITELTEKSICRAVFQLNGTVKDLTDYFKTALINKENVSIYQSIIRRVSHIPQGSKVLKLKPHFIKKHQLK